MAPISFARGAPSPACLDPELLTDCARVALERDATTILSYGTGGGYGPLREVLAGRHDVDPGRVFLTTGGLQGFVFYSAVQLARRPGRVLVEGPTYDRPLKLLRWQGVDVVALEMDEEGLVPEVLEAELERGGEISFLYTIPTFQNPSGRTLGERRRLRIAELSRAYDLDVLEDDPYGLVRYEGTAPPRLHALEGGERVTFTSSFSKTVAPGLRVGWFVVPEALVAAYDERAVSTYISPPLLTQAIVHELFERSEFRPNLDRIRGILREQRDAMLTALDEGLAGRATWNRPDGGYFLWVDFEGGVDAGDLLARATEAGVTFVRGSDFFPGASSGTSSARLAFSYEPPERIAEGVRILAGLL
ncbi:MAG TPA: PLP-dependent aminotransferase family protein [Gaiella sp.]